MTLLSIVVMTSYAYSGSQKKGDSLDVLWRKYERARKEDRIQDMEDILAEVKANALEARASWDYFSACDEYLNVKSRHNWKLNDSLRKQTSEELQNYGVPVLHVLFELRQGTGRADIISLVDKYLQDLQRSSNNDIYAKAQLFNGKEFNEFMSGKIENDYEFSLWAMRKYQGFGNDWVYARLEEFYKHHINDRYNRYPSAPYARFLKITDGFDMDVIMSELQALADEYAGRGIGMLAKDRLFRLRQEKMDLGGASSEDFRRLEKDIIEFLAEGRKLTGDEAIIYSLASESEPVLEQLRRKEAWTEIKDGEVILMMRNLDKAEFRMLKDKKLVYEEEISNPVNSFYKPDTVKVNVPVLDDGYYATEVHAGKELLDEGEYGKHTISLATRSASDGKCAYAADYMTGKPFGKADLLLYDSRGEMIAQVKDFEFDGFTPLPKKIYPLKDDKTYYLACRCADNGTVRLSEKMAVRNGYRSAHDTSVHLSAAIMKNKGAFVSGDTLTFKAVLYNAFPDGLMRTADKEREVLVRLVDSRRNTVAEKVLLTNEFGSVSGTFAVGEEGRNGMYNLIVYGDAEGKMVAGSTNVRVDEFLLPSYDLTFDEQDKLYFPGDTVRVSGKVSNYSGHGFDGLAAEADIVIAGYIVETRYVKLKTDGSFEIFFKAGDDDDDYVHYGVDIVLTDSTGETLEYEHYGFLRESFAVEAEFINAEDGECRIVGDSGFRSLLISDDTAEIICNVNSYSHNMDGVPSEYFFRQGDVVLNQGSVMSSDTLSMDLSAFPTGVYEFELKAAMKNGTGREIKASRTYKLIYLRDDDNSLPGEVDRVVRGELKDGNIIMQIGSGTGPIWAVMELFGENKTVLKKEIVYVGGVADRPESMLTVDYEYKTEYPDQVLLNVFFFRNGEDCHYGEWFSRPKEEAALPLEFVSFSDKALPGQECTVKMKTDPGAELVASVYDISLDKIAENLWVPVEKDNRGQYQYVMYTAAAGAIEDSGNGFMNFFNLESDSAETAMYRNASAKRVASDVVVREDFADALAFEPFLRPDKDGAVEMKFRTSDKLSTFRVMAYAHDKEMNNSLISGEILVTLPVKVSVVAPQYLYEGDRYVMNASVSNVSGVAVKGSIYMEMYDGEVYMDAVPLKVDSAEVVVSAGGSVSADFAVDVPEGVDALGFKVVFVGYEYSSDMAVNDVLISDGMFVPVPVRPDEQVVKESHSAVLLEGQSEEEVLERLRKEFVNMSSTGAEYREISIKDMMLEAVPGAVAAESDDAVSLSEALYLNVVAYGLHGGRWGLQEEDSVEAKKYVRAAKDAMEKLLKCANGDGGFGWFEGMPSSPIVTAYVLDEFARFGRNEDFAHFSELLGEDDFDELDEAVLKAVKYIDEVYFSEPDRPYWCGRLSLEQYLSLRSDYSGIPFDAEAARERMGRKKYEKFQKDVREYLSPKASGGKNAGHILSKLRVIKTVRNLGSDEGRALARAWGVSSEEKMLKARKTAVESLKQYAVEHPSGGVYYPNAVMPWRGLLETELYAHALIAEMAVYLYSSEEDFEWMKISRGICLWMMLQKETQQWTSGTGFIDALRAVYHISDTWVTDVRILVLEKRSLKPLDEIKASGNGFTVSVDYYIDRTDRGRTRLADGDSLHVGDKITAVYSLWSQENRSFVKLDVPRPACLRPADQLSGWAGGWFRPLRYGSMNVTPYSYREVKADRTLYWFDVFPEEKTTIEEELFVTQEGKFAAHAATVESLYAPHYRANGVPAIVCPVKD